jgi:predicted metal-dependent hydrolase
VLAGEDVVRQSSDPDRVIPVRRISFEDAIANLDRDFADGDVIMSHLLAALSGLFPDGEEMFVDSVRHFRDEITDPDLLRQVNAFIGQESMHGREHRRLNERLDQLGYRAKLVERTMEADAPITPAMRNLIWLVTRVGPLRGLPEHIAAQRASGGARPVFRLALTAALEHFTATMARTFLTDPELHSLITDEEFLRFWTWHAIEENEHKAVAFDVYKATGGDEETRLRAMRLATLALVFVAGFHTTIGVLRDRRSWMNFGLAQSLWRLRNNPFLSSAFRAASGDYNRADFHPLQHDTSELEEAWRAWLDGEGPRPELAG